MNSIMEAELLNRREGLGLCWAWLLELEFRWQAAPMRGIAVAGYRETTANNCEAPHTSLPAVLIADQDRPQEYSIDGGLATEAFSPVN
jgi:hypothetical protein